MLLSNNYTLRIDLDYALIGANHYMKIEVIDIKRNTMDNSPSQKSEAVYRIISL